MVEFKIKTVATNDCTLHASYPDLYDGTAPYLKVGGDDEPKKSLVRFAVAEKPSYGNAELKGGEVGFYTTGLSASQGAFPTYNIYKLKTDPNDSSAWSGDGRIRTVPRGKQIVGITVTNVVNSVETGSYVNVLNHQLNTGDRIYHSPFTLQFSDVKLPDITPELEYYAIRVDRDNFAFATSIANALAGTRITLAAYSSYNYVPVGASDGTFTGLTGPWGYVRAETYKQDIHVVTAKPKGAETISENFNGSAYRESDLGFESIERQIIRKTNPYVTRSKDLWDNPEGTKRTQGEEGAWRTESEYNLKRWYGHKQDDGQYFIFLEDHESNADGSGWWRTAIEGSKWRGGYEYVPKTSPNTGLTPNSRVKFTEETLTGSEPYGDEITPANSIFHIVKGASEFTSAPPDGGEGENTLDATGAIRFSSEVKKTGGQAMNMYSFWKATATGITYPKSRQESYAVYKGLPMPSVEWGLIDFAAFGHGKFPVESAIAAGANNVGNQDWTLSMKVNFKKLEMAYCVGTDAAEDTIYSRRGFHVIIASSPPISGESYYDYVLRLSNAGTWQQSLLDDDDHDGVGFSIMNTSSAEALVTHDSEGEFTGTQKLKIFDLKDSVVSSGDVKYANEDHAEDSEGGAGVATMMEEGEWYDIKVIIPTHTANQAILTIENEDGQNITEYLTQDYYEEEAAGVKLLNFGGSATTSGTDSQGNFYGYELTSASRLGLQKWWQHLSIWSTNTKTGFKSSSTTNGTDWMANKEDRDTENNIFIDSISLYGVNLSHTNATIGQQDRSSRGRISITGSETHESCHGSGSINEYAFNKKGPAGTVGGAGSNIRRADNAILLGFEDPSQISSAYDIEPSWRYLFWNGYISANLGSDRKITFTAGDSLPATTGINSSRQPVADTEWFNAINSTATVGDWDNFEGITHGISDTWMLGGGHDGAGSVNPQLAPYADAGMPIAFSEYGTKMAPTAVAFYSDAHHTTGATFSDEVMCMRNLFMNRTYSIDDSGDEDPDSIEDTTEGLYGSEQPMASMCPSLGAIVAPSANRIVSGVITMENGPFGGRGQFWKTGQPVVYYNNGNTSITNLTSAKGDFSDTPSGTSTGKYYLIRTASKFIVASVKITNGGSGYGSVPTCQFTTAGGNGEAAGTAVLTAGVVTSVIMTNPGADYTSLPVMTFTGGSPSVNATGVSISGDNRRFKLAATEEDAHDGDAITAPSGTPSGNHIFYDYDYYVNRKYFIDGFSSKGLMKMILQPTKITSWSNATPSTSTVIVDDYLDVDKIGYSFWHPTYEYFTDYNADGNEEIDTAITNAEALLTKRENMACAAKVLEVLEAPNASNSSVLTLRVDTVEPLYSVEGTKYRLFLLGASGTSSYKSDMTITILSNETIQVDNWNGKADDGTKMIGLVKDDMARDTTLSRLWVGPEKYWVGFLVRNQSGYSSTTVGTLPNKSYESVCVVAPSGGERTAYTDQGQGQSSLYPAWGTPGATYNESTYSADKVSGIRGAYVNNWAPTPDMDPNQTIYDLQDYGYGAAKEDKESSGSENNVLGGYAGKFIPRTGQINKVKIPKLFDTGEAKIEGDNIDIAIQAESATTPSVLSVASMDNGTLPKPFLLTVFEDAKPANPTNFKVIPYEKDAFYPEFKWSAGDSDLWYGFIIIDDKPINNQYHRSLLHVPLNEDLRTVASSYDNDKGYYYASAASPVVYGHRYENTTITPSGVHAGGALNSAGTEKVSAVGVNLYDSEEGLAGNTKYFTSGSYAEFNYHTTVTSSDFSYPVDEMSVLVHITPTAWGANSYIASFNVSTDTTTTKDSWGIYMDANGQINAFVSAFPGATHQTTYAELKSTTKVPIDGTPTSIILTVDTQLHSGNMKLFINGKLEDLTGMRGTISTNNWPTDLTGHGGYPIFQLKNVSYDESLFIGAKAQNGSSVGQNSFEGKIEEFVWYDKCIYPVTPQDGKYVLEKPLEELVSDSSAASSKSYVARLFVKDYHNIRGKTTGEVAASSQISWKKAAFELYT